MLQLDFVVGFLKHLFNLVHSNQQYYDTRSPRLSVAETPNGTRNGGAGKAAQT
jgi:hypothetical protein